MMGAKLVEVVAAIGKKAIWHVDGMEVKVKITDAKLAWGRVRYLIETEFGTTKWVDSSNLAQIGSGAIKFTVKALKELLLP